MNKNTNQMYKIYFAGELFSLKHLLGNSAIAQAITAESDGRFQCILPQELEQRETTAEAIRDQDLLTLASCDLGLFNFDGPEIDSGTVVEFMVAKFLDIPSVILRTDFRAGGDQGVEPWNLMMSYYPRTKVIMIDAMAEFQKQLNSLLARNPQATDSLSQSVQAGINAAGSISKKTLAAFEELLATESILTKALREPVYNWFRIFAGTSFSTRLSVDDILGLLERKQGLALL